MDGSAPNPFCTKCGTAVPPGAAFCPRCGNPVAVAATQFPESPPTMLPTGVGGTTVPTPARQAADAATIGPTGIATSLESPSPRPRVHGGDGPFQAGQQVGPRYTILKLLGVGGMGAVYQAFDHELGVAVAIKVIRPAAQSDATAAKDLELRFKRELVLARQVTHKNVVRIHDLGEIDGIKYLTMPFVEGETLAQLLERVGSLPVTDALPWARQIAQGLAAAHEKGVVHRDLKPENIMIEKPSPQSEIAGGHPGGDALIMDFGIARSVEHGATQTAAGSVIGTLNTAPNGVGGKIDQRVDIYAGLDTTCVGRHRLAKKESAMTELIERLSSSPPSPRSLKPEIPEALDRLVMKCLAPKANDRFASTADLVKALDGLTLDGHEFIPADTSMTSTILIQKPARPMWQLIAAGLLLVSLAGGAGWLISNRAPSGPPAEKEPISVLIADFNNDW